MEALEFLKEHKRMCNEYSRSYNGCCDCPLVSHCSISSVASDEDNKKTVDVVEQWSKEHPRKTRQSVFLEQYPEARIGDDGVLQIYPCLISASHRNARGNCVTMGRKCPDCRHEFWMQEAGGERKRPRPW